jgi:hypothetical protein
MSDDLEAPPPPPPPLLAPPPSDEFVIEPVPMPPVEPEAEPEVKTRKSVIYEQLPSDVRDDAPYADVSAAIREAQRDMDEAKAHVPQMLTTASEDNSVGGDLWCVTYPTSPVCTDEFRVSSEETAIANGGHCKRGPLQRRCARLCRGRLLAADERSSDQQWSTCSFKGSEGSSDDDNGQQCSVRFPIALCRSQFGGNAQPRTMTRSSDRDEAKSPDSREFVKYLISVFEIDVRFSSIR